MNENPSVSIEEVQRHYKIVSYNHDHRTKENMLAWNQACRSYMEAATTLEELEQLLSPSTIFCGIAAGTIQAECFQECQDRLAKILVKKIEGCTNLDEISQITQKLYRIYRAEGHVPIGKTSDTTRALFNACLKWYELCQTKEELVQMMRDTDRYVSIYNLIGR